MIACDTETTGLDSWHGAKPFLVTIAEETSNGIEIAYWEWEVDPLTREPQIPKTDLDEVRQALYGQEVVFQNAKFDVRMLSRIGVTEWDWSKIYDTLIASHLIDSAKPRNLTFSVLHYLGIDVSPYEDRMQEIVTKARRLAKKEFPDWRLAGKGLEDMPSAKEKVWKYDLWVPRAMAKHSGLAELTLFDVDEGIPEEWSTVVAEYANTDSETTLLLWREQERIIKEAGLWKIFQHRMKHVQPIYDMEEYGVTLSEKRLTELENEYREESTRAGTVCTSIARSMDYDLELPKAANNNSLLEFVFDKLKLPVVATSRKTGKPSFDKNVMAHYLSTLPPRSKGGRFISNLAAKRKRDTALGYMEGYRKFMLPMDVDKEGWYVLHPSVNPTGTATLRSSSKNPNEQNISKKEGFNLRYTFGPAPGREWWSLDYDNLELRIPGYECEEPAMLELFEKPNEPPYFGSYHLLIFDILYPDLFKKHGTKVKDIYKSTLYQYTKNGNFAELYGAVDVTDMATGKVGTADAAFHFPGAQRRVAAKLKKKAALNQHYITYARNYGYVETLPDKTVDPDRGYPLNVYAKNKWGRDNRDVSPTVPLNYHVQGTSCWVKGSAMVKCHAYLAKHPGHYLIMDIHDELVFDFPYKPNKGNLPKIRKIKNLMESCGDDIGIPLTCGLDYHPHNWSTAS